MTRITIDPQQELAPDNAQALDLDKVRRPQYGRWLDDMGEGQVFLHPRGYTFERSEMRAFATTFHQANPIYLNRELALVHGFGAVPATPQMVFNVVLSLGVQNNSEKAVANLGYYNARFLRPVYAGDTLRALTRVRGIRDRGPDKPGIAHVETIGLNQREEVVLQYERKIMIRHRPEGVAPAQAALDIVDDSKPPAEPTSRFRWDEEPVIDLPIAPKRGWKSFDVRTLTGPSTYFEDFAPGDVIVHGCGRTITDEHVGWTYRVGNTHPLHYDRIYSSSQSGPMSGEPIVYGGLVFAWLEGLASRDTSENALWELGFTEGYHTAPAVTGDTVYALSRVLDCNAEAAGVEGAGVVTLQLIGVKNATADAMLAEHGDDLFIKEGSKKKLGKDKIPAKIFEIERQLLIKRKA